MKSFFAVNTLSILLCCIWTSAYAHDDPHEATFAITTLLSIANDSASHGLHCDGDYPGNTHQLKVRDIIAEQLSVFNNGKNTIKGSCKNNKCAVVMHHANGEDVSSTTIMFNIKNDKALVNTMSCIITP